MVLLPGGRGDKDTSGCEGDPRVQREEQPRRGKTHTWWSKTKMNGCCTRSRTCLRGAVAKAAQRDVGRTILSVAGNVDTTWPLLCVGRRPELKTICVAHAFDKQFGYHFAVGSDLEPLDHVTTRRSFLRISKMCSRLCCSQEGLKFCTHVKIMHLMTQASKKKTSNDQGSETLDSISSGLGDQTAAPRWLTCSRKSDEADWCSEQVESMQARALQRWWYHVVDA